MGKKLLIYKKRLSSFFLCPLIILWFLSGCATPPSGQKLAVEEKAPVIERVMVNSGDPSKTVIEIQNSEYAPYTSFKLNDPPRVILDIRGEQGAGLPRMKEIKDGRVRLIAFEEGKTQALTTRMTVILADNVDYNVSDENNKIRLNVASRPEAAKPVKPAEVTAAKAETEKTEIIPSEPRIMFKPGPSDLNHVLGIDFTRFDFGKSRLLVTTEKSPKYDLDRKGEKALILTLYDADIPPLLLREIDTTHFESALDKVTPVSPPGGKEVAIVISLREMVPFHVKQTDEGIVMDFAQTSIKPPEKKIMPIDLAGVQTRTLAAEQPPVKTTGLAASAAATSAARPEGDFKGEPMYLDFNNEDVTNILRLINEVSSDNIIWDPAIAGRKVSMILKGVPWDEALDLILINNDLAKRYVGDNILWITTKAKMKQIEAEEEAERLKAQKLVEDEIKKQQEQKVEKPEEPLVTEYLPVDFAKADEIQKHIVLTQRGKTSIDTRTNTIIITDIADSIAQAKKTIKQFDTPVKQIMIEARIVDATDRFSRNMGIQWNSLTGAWRKKNATTTVPGDATTFTREGERVWGGTFSTNTPDSWDSNINLNFARLTSSGLGAITLDASLALAESEGTAKVMSAPKVIAREGTAATISSGDSIIIPATENVASTTLDATLSLTVTPTAVSYNNFITLDVAVTDDQAPSTSRLLRKAINTTLMIKSGETVVIGGILKESEGQDETGIPGLRNIPVFGNLFKAKTKSHQKSELLIFLTPTVLPSPVKDF